MTVIINMASSGWNIHVRKSIKVIGSGQFSKQPRWLPSHMDSVALSLLPQSWRPNLQSTATQPNRLGGRELAGSFCFISWWRTPVEKWTNTLWVWVWLAGKGNRPLESTNRFNMSIWQPSVSNSDVHSTCVSFHCQGPCHLKAPAEAIYLLSLVDSGLAENTVRLNIISQWDLFSTVWISSCGCSGAWNRNSRCQSVVWSRQSSTNSPKRSLEGWYLKSVESGLELLLGVHGTKPWFLQYYNGF